MLKRIIVIRNGEIVWKHGPYCWDFRLTLKVLGWPYRKYIKTAKNACIHCFSEEFLVESDFQAVLTTFCCCDYGWNASEVAEKITKDKKDCHKCSLCVIFWEWNFSCNNKTNVIKSVQKITQKLGLDSFIYNELSKTSTEPHGQFGQMVECSFKN